MRTRTQVALIGSGAVLVMGVGTAVAAGGVAAAPPVIHACKANSGGAVRIVGKDTKCRKAESRVTWNQRGAAGPRGPSDAYYSVGGEVPVSGPTDKEVVAVRLPAGSYVVNATVQTSRLGWVGCHWSAGPNTRNVYREDVAMPMSLLTALALTKPGRVAVLCRANAVGENFVARAVITATRVATLTSAPG